MYHRTCISNRVQLVESVEQRWAMGLEDESPQWGSREFWGTQSFRSWSLYVHWCV